MMVTGERVLGNIKQDSQTAYSLHEMHDTDNLSKVAKNAEVVYTL